ncbi:DinB family protein [Actibacterium sp. 188UL27-1]|nr:DinB family protein [Actibacterium sp. 188UL27-1]MBM7067882.1 DinB family protein [Actibacterium sp. 188UL27-1]
MARYNAWQNGWVAKAVQSMKPADVTKDRGAFFGSIFGTLNHLLWGDQMWLSRLADMPPPAGKITTAQDTAKHCKTVAQWAADRSRTDGQIRVWADGLRPIHLRGDLTWHSAVVDGPISQSMTMCIVTMFNHQIHHRGQVHAMLTAAGVKTADTDLPFMPDTV